MTVTDEEIEKLAKAVLAAHQALDIDMGDGEPTWQCCNSVCGHGRCVVGDAVEIAARVSELTEADISSMNYARRMGGLQPPLLVSKRGEEHVPLPYCLCDTCSKERGAGG
jgi:hypothetical protein